MKLVICMMLVVMCNIAPNQAAPIDTNDGSSLDLERAIKMDETSDIGRIADGLGHSRQRRAIGKVIGKAIGKVLKKVKGKGKKGKGKGQANVNVQQQGRKTEVNANISAGRTIVQGNASFEKGQQPKVNLNITRQF